MHPVRHGDPDTCRDRICLRMVQGQGREDCRDSHRLRCAAIRRHVRGKGCDVKQTIRQNLEQRTFMAVVKRTQVINKPVDVVFQTVVDVSSFPNWNPTTPSARKLSNGEIGNGTRFELEIRGIGKVQHELREFDRNKQVRLVPSFKLLSGGHRFIFTAEGAKTRIDHELEMTTKGVFKIFTPLMGMMGKKNLRDTANALQRYLERT